MGGQSGDELGVYTLWRRVEDNLGMIWVYFNEKGGGQTGDGLGV